MLQKIKDGSVWAVPLFLLWLAIHYWDPAVGLAARMAAVTSPLLIGFCVAYVVDILMSLYERVWGDVSAGARSVKLRRVVCMVLAFATLFLLAHALLRMVVPEIWNASTILIDQIAGLLKMGQAWLVQSELLNAEQLLQLNTTLEEWAKTLVGWVSSSVTNIVTGAFGFVSSVANLFISLVFSVHLLLNKERLIAQLKTVLQAYVPERAVDALYHVGRVANTSFHSYISGQCIEAIVLGTLCSLGMTVLGMPYAAMIGSVVGVTALIPFAGAYIGAAVGAIMIATTSPLQALGFVVFLVVLQQIEGNLIYPQVAGRVIGLPGIWIIAAVTIGGGLGGILGMVLSVPLTATVYHLLREDLQARAARGDAAASGSAPATPTSGNVPDDANADMPSDTPATE